MLVGEEASGGDTGMVLPFVPSVVTFQDIHYFVEVPKVNSFSCTFITLLRSSVMPPPVARQGCLKAALQQACVSIAILSKASTAMSSLT